MPRFEENKILMEKLKSFDLIESSDFRFTVLASKRKNDDEDNGADDDDNFEEEEVEENPFDKEPTENDIIEDDIPLFDPEDELLDDEEEDEIPYN